MINKNLKEISCPCCGEKTLKWAKDGSYMPDIPFVWITCNTCDFDFGAEWKQIDCDDMLSEFKYYLNNNK